MISVKCGERTVKRGFCLQLCNFEKKGRYQIHRKHLIDARKVYTMVDWGGFGKQSSVNHHCIPYVCGKSTVIISYEHDIILRSITFFFNGVYVSP